MIANKGKVFRMVVIALSVIYCFCTFVPIASAEGSNYIHSFAAGMTAGSNGNVTVSFQVTCVSTMDEIGSTKIEIYENGSLVKTYLSTNTTGMMGYNKVSHGNTVTYAGTVGKTYDAHVVFKAGKNGGWDNRSLDTNKVTAKN